VTAAALLASCALAGAAAAQDPAPPMRPAALGDEAIPLPMPIPRVRELPVAIAGVAGDPPWSPQRLQGVKADARVAALVDRLDSRDFAQRESAGKELLEPSIPDEQVWLQLVERGDRLSAESHARLVEVARLRIVDAPRGALGIQMAPRFGETDGVTVTGLIPNMPARKVLRGGDRIVELDGQRIRVSNELSAVVQAHRPGNRIRVVVMRGERDELGRVRGGPDGKPLETRVELEIEVGAREDLERFGDGGMDSPVVDTGRLRLAEAMRQRFPGPVRTLRAERVPGEALDVDGHPEIVRLRELLSDPDALGANAMAVFRSRLANLRAVARMPGLSDAERQWFEAVANRYLELVPEPMRPEGGPG